MTQFCFWLCSNFSLKAGLSGGDTHIPEEADGKKKRQKGGPRSRRTDKRSIACHGYIFSGEQVITD